MDAVRERGVRVTAGPRLPSLAEVREHVTAEEVWERAGSTLPGLGLWAIHRSLEAVGIVANSPLPEVPRPFEARSALHPHLMCESCGENSHPEPGAGHRLFEALSVGSGHYEVHAVARGPCVGEPRPARSRTQTSRSRGEGGARQ